jgi:hypothetical protein
VIEDLSVTDPGRVTHLFRLFIWLVENVQFNLQRHRALLLRAHDFITKVPANWKRSAFELGQILLMILGIPFTARIFSPRFSCVRLMDREPIEKALGFAIEPLADRRSSNCLEFAVVIERSEFSALVGLSRSFQGPTFLRLADCSALYRRSCE